MTISPAKSPEPAAARRPIAAVRISTVALLGIVSAVAVPAGAAALVLSGTIDGKHQSVGIAETRKVTKVVIEDSNGSVHVNGDPTRSGVSGTADLTWHGSDKPPLGLDQSVTDGVLTLKRVCLRGGCGGGADITISLPPDVAVQVHTSNGAVEVYDVTGDVDLHTSNSPITVGRLGGGKATLRTSNGPVEAGFTGAPALITISTSNAPVTVTLDGRTPYYDYVTADNGKIDLQNKPDRYADHEVHVDTSNGDVTVK
ncbi:MAG: DUF4097 family beta strand repeat protein [Catenulispora sp.]|nr:DUF4097 family beta strand repeat protein [Catenulispora sp.]